MKYFKQTLFWFITIMKVFVLFLKILLALGISCEIMPADALLVYIYKWRVCRTKCNWIGNTSQVLVLLHVNIRTHFKGRIFTILLNFMKNTTETQKLAGCKDSKKQCMMETKLYFCLVSMFLSKNHTFHV